MKIINNMPDGACAEMWDNADWSELEETLLEMQRGITRAVYGRNTEARIDWQTKLVRSLCAKMLAVRHVCASISSPGVDGIKWTTSAEKMRAAISLTSKDYKASPMKMIVIVPKGSTKKRNIQIPSSYDRAMQTLYAYSLDPVAENGERKSFAFRKGRSMQDAHAFIMKGLSGVDAPRYVVKADVKACYASISHEWLLANIPMDTKVLLQFLKAGHVFAGEIFPPDDYGISLGSSISPILGNMALDGMQAAIFEGLHGAANGEIDYAEGNLIRFADDCFITARTKESAAKIIDLLSVFLRPRGMKLSDEKTKIVDLNNGLDFLSRNYRSVKGVVYAAPSENAVAKFEESLRDLILNYRGSQGALIEKLNQKLNGWATYHKITDARAAFRHIDTAVKAYLLQLCEKLHPSLPRQSVINKYFFKGYDGEYIYALIDKSDVRVIRLADVVLTDHKPISLSKNPYLDDDYHEARHNDREIQNVSGKYKAIWTRQSGKCHYCGQSILADQRKAVVARDATYFATVKNLAYIHAKCEPLDVQFIETDAPLDSENDVQAVLEGLADKTKRYRSQTLKFSPLAAYFLTQSANKVTLTFKEIEKIIGAPLCASAHKYIEYWYRRGHERISECWLANGYKLTTLDLENERATFTRVDENVAAALPPFLQGRIPPNCKAELDNFYAFLKSKYGL
ncbi:group II intron reverse transcriptase/maturase [Clostridia bacterium]|nr:group II intron reverse transcriptase/maturase [Clostridia bacterium]GHV33314.1 group II intron reverse transcriptase/maturase [Clostridia bacterium]